MPCVLVALAVCLLPLAASAAPPNVVVILADDLGWTDLGCYGSTFHKTPHLDRLAKDGLRFTDAYSASPVCSPTRAALLTGQYPARIGITDWLPGRPDRPDQRMKRPPLVNQLPMEAVTLAELFKAAGYATGHVGKWHLGGDGFGPTRQGFDVNVGGDDTGTPLSYFAPFQNKGRAMPGLEQAPAGEYLTDRYTDEAEKFVRANAAKPFFLYLAHNAVHTPLRAKSDVVAKYANKPTPGRQSNAVYAAMLESLDSSVGRVRAVLDELKLAGNTIVLFTSDNGGLATLEGMPAPPTINAPLREGKGHVYEGGIRVPFLAAGPGPAKGTTATTVSSYDVLPTLCDLCGLTPPPVLDGKSFAATLRGQPEPARPPLYWHYPHYSNQTSRPAGAVRDGNLKLIEFYDSGRRELFDLKADPRENNNLAAARPKDVERLAKMLADWRTAVGAKMMTPNPDYTPNPQAADGTITLPARWADVHGTQLRYEPLPHKNTLGFWTQQSDWADWEFTVTKPGTFTVEVLQGCGTGQGGSTAAVEVGGQRLTFTVDDTGGFQAFKPRDVGTVTIDKVGRHTLAVKAVTKARAAVMDVRAITLRPKAGG